MKESLKQRLNVFLKLRRRLASAKWILLFITTVMFFLSAASSTCTFSFGGGGPSVLSSPTGLSSSGTTSAIQSSPPSLQGSPVPFVGSPPSLTSSPTSSLTPTPPSTGKTVKIVPGAKAQSCAFVPGSVTILEGDTVTWSNTTSASHTVTSDDSSGPIKSSQIKSNGTYSLTFSKIGTFKYHCDSHPTQGGAIVVKA